MVTIGALGFWLSASSSSSSSSISACASMSINSTSKPNSPPTNSITSASNRWLMETMIPKPIHLPITSAKLTSIRLANSLTLINSVTINLLSSPPSILSAISSLLAFLCLAFMLFPRLEPPESLAWVSLILSCISFWSISLSSRRLSVDRGPKRLACPGLLAAPCAGLLYPPCPGAPPGLLNPPPPVPACLCCAPGSSEERGPKRLFGPVD